MQNSPENKRTGTHRNDYNSKDHISYQTDVASPISHLIGYFDSKCKIRLF